MPRFHLLCRTLKHGLKHLFGRIGFRFRQGFGQNENIHNKTHRKNSKVHEKSTNNLKNIFISYREQGKGKRKNTSTNRVYFKCKHGGNNN